MLAIAGCRCYHHDDIYMYISIIYHVLKIHASICIYSDAVSTCSVLLEKSQWSNCHITSSVSAHMEILMHMQLDSVAIGPAVNMYSPLAQS